MVIRQLLLPTCSGCSNNVWQKIGRRLIIHSISIVLLFLMIEPLLTNYVNNKILSIANGLVLLFIILMYCFVFIADIQKRFALKKVEIIFIVYVLYCISGSYANNNMSFNIIKILQYELRFVFLFFVLIRVNITKKDIVVFFKYFMVFCLVQITLGFIQYISGDDFRILFVKADYVEASLSNFNRVIETHRVVGTLLNKTIFSTFIFFQVLLNFYLLKYLFHNKWFLNVFSIICIVSLIIATSRTIWVLLAVFLVYVYFKKKIYLLIPSVVFVIVLILLLPNMSSGLVRGEWLYRVYEIFSPEYYEMIQSVGRVAYINATLNLLSEMPVWGLGGGNWGLGLALSDDSFEYSEVNAFGYILTDGIMHDNNWASIAGQFGIGALLLFLGLLFYPLKLFIKSFRMNYDCFAKNMAVVGILFIVAMFLIGFTQTPFVTRSVSFFFWCSIGLFYSYLQKYKEYKI